MHQAFILILRSFKKFEDLHKANLTAGAICLTIWAIVAYILIITHVPEPSPVSVKQIEFTGDLDKLRREFPEFDIRSGEPSTGSLPGTQAQ